VYGTNVSEKRGEPTPKGKLLTGELCAGEPHAQFGGRGGRQSFPTPIIGREPLLATLIIEAVEWLLSRQDRNLHPWMGL
jgi:hypothetical protein